MLTEESTGAVEKVKVVAKAEKAEAEAARAEEKAVARAAVADYRRGWNDAVNAIALDLTERIARGPAGERAGLMGLLDEVAARRRR